MSETEKEAAEKIEALERRIAELEAKAKPPKPFVPDPNRQPYDPTANASMPPSALRMMVDAVPGAMVRQIVGGNRAPKDLAPLAGGGVRPTVASENRTGWRNPAPLTNPPGVALADKLMDVAHARDRAGLIEREARRLAKPKG